MSSVVCARISFSYPGRAALSDFSTVMASGRHTVITGTNGSGKSTLLGIIAGVLKPAQGAVTLTTGHRPAYVIQHTRTPLVMPCTARQAVEMGRWPHRPRLFPLRKRDEAVVDSAMERMGVAELADRQLSELSGGQRQRTLIAQGLAQESDILILDEPTAGLDASAHQLIRTAVDEEVSRGVTVIESSHHAGDIDRAHRVLTLAAGRIVSDTGGASPRAQQR